MEPVIQKRKITPVLMKMGVGEEQKFPIEQIDSLSTVIQRLQNKHLRQGLKWSSRKCDREYCVLITRTA